jgi:hypothetical protein
MNTRWMKILNREFMMAVFLALAPCCEVKEVKVY